MAWKDHHRHTFAVVERQTIRSRGARMRLLSTHKTKAAAERAMPYPRRGEQYGVFLSAQCTRLPAAQGWTDYTPERPDRL